MSNVAKSREEITRKITVPNHEPILPCTPPQNASLPSLPPTPTHEIRRHAHCDVGLLPQRTSPPAAFHQTSPPHLMRRSTAPLGVIAGRTSRKKTGSPVGSG